MASVQLLELSQVADYIDHMREADADSGVGAPHFHPYSATAPFDRAEALAREQRRWQTPLDAPGWRRAWGWLRDGQLVGHAYLAGGHLASELHRASLGMALQAGHRRQGGGSALLSSVVAWARAAPQLAWIDLGVFAENSPAQAVYQRFGFSETGRVADRFRVDGVSIDDIQMSLWVGPEAR